MEDDAPVAKETRIVRPLDKRRVAAIAEEQPLAISLLGKLASAVLRGWN